MPNRATLGVPERPVTPMHYTIEPPGSHDRLVNLGTEILLSVLERLRELVAVLPAAHDCDGFNVFVNDRRHGRQSVGEMPDEDGRLRFHVLGRRGDEPMAPTTILNAPEEFPLEPISEQERTNRLATLEAAAASARSTTTAMGASADVSVASGGSAEAAGEPRSAGDRAGDECSLCAADDQELVRGDTARVLRPQRPLIPANVLLSPLRHVTHLGQLSDDEFVGLFRMFDQVAATFGQVHESNSFNLFGNDGKVAGQHVPHLHIHVLGRAEHEDTDPYELLRGLRFNLRR